MRDTLAAAGLELSDVEVEQVEAALADVEAACLASNCPEGIYDGKR